MRDCPAFGQWQLGPANRGSFGSPAINDLSGAEPQWGAQVGYKPSYAQQQMRARRWTGGRLERGPVLRRAVLERLRRGWSPEQIAGRLARDYGRKVISHETIYRFIYGQLRRTSDFSWRRYLPRAKSKRGLRGKRGGSPASFIEGRVSLANRPPRLPTAACPGIGRPI